MNSIETYMNRQQAQKDSSDQQRLLALQAANDLKTVLELAEGRRVLRRILAHCRTQHATFTPGHTDVTAFLEGRRDVGIFLTALLSEHKSLYLTLLSEDLYGTEQSDNHR